MYTQVSIKNIAQGVNDNPATRADAIAEMQKRVTRDEAKLAQTGKGEGKLARERKFLAQLESGGALDAKAAFERELTKPAPVELPAEQPKVTQRAMLDAMREADPDALAVAFALLKA
jgi:hypothetical protein